jgi:hypothetical protein
MSKMSRRTFLALAATTFGVAIATRAGAHHKPGHNHGPKPTPTAPPPTTTTSPPTTTVPPPTSTGFGPELGAQWVRDHVGTRPVVAPTGVSFASASALQSEIDADPNRVFVAEGDEIVWDRTVETN